MSRTKRNQKDIFNDFIQLRAQMQRLSTIVQNSDMEVSFTELAEWGDNVNLTINKLNMLREDVFRFYQD